MVEILIFVAIMHIEITKIEDVGLEIFQIFFHGGMWFSVFLGILLMFMIQILVSLLKDTSCFQRLRLTTHRDKLIDTEKEATCNVENLVC